MLSQSFHIVRLLLLHWHMYKKGFILHWHMYKKGTDSTKKSVHSNFGVMGKK